MSHKVTFSNGKTLEINDEELEKLCDDLRKNGWYPTSLTYEGLDTQFSEEVTIVGNNKVW